MKTKLLPLTAAIAVAMSQTAFAEQNDSQDVRQLKKEVKALRSEIHHINAVNDRQQCEITVEHKAVHHIDIPSPLYFGAVPVLSGAYIGRQRAFDSSDLVVNIPSTNEDFRLLQQQQNVFKTYFEGGIPYPKNPFVVFSGKVEGALTASTPYSGTRTSDINLGGAELDAAAILNRWAISFLGFSYDPAAPQPSDPPITRVTNSRVYLSKGFLSIGNLDKSPVYGTIGQFVVPFGLYASNMLNPTLPAVLGQMTERAILLGYNTGKTGPYGSIFTFRGDSGTGGSKGHINQVGVNLGVANQFNNRRLGCIKTDFGGGYISNIADSAGMQANGQTEGFTGFGASTNTEVLQRRVPAIDLRGNVAFGKFDFKAEFVDAIRSFKDVDMSYNGYAARPMAFNTEGSYSFMTYSHPSAVALGFGASSEALALLIPQQRYSAIYNISLWRYTVGALEYHHDVNYPAGSSAAGGGVANAPVITGNTLGRTSDTLTAQIGVYF